MPQAKLDQPAKWVLPDLSARLDNLSAARPVLVVREVLLGLRGVRE